MQKFIKTVVLGLFFSLPAFAQSVALVNQDLMQITAEKFPGKTFHMGAIIGQSRDLQGFYYDDQYLVRHTVSVANAKQGVVLITMDAKKPFSSSLTTFNVVILAIDYHPETLAAEVEFSYLYNGLTGKYITQKMNLVYDAAKNVFLILNEKNQLVSKARVWTRYILGAEAGIDHIDFSF